MPSLKKAPWPELPLAAWTETCDTLHLYTQVVGKVRLVLSPMTNQWWQVPLYLTSRGLTTSPIPYGHRTFELDFDFIDHNLVLKTSDGATRGLALVPRSVADFYGEVMAILHAEGLDVEIDPMPSEIPGAISFTEDRVHAAYDPEYARRFWEILRRVDTVFKEFRGRFTGKSSPVHFFWGSFDLAVSRFCGRHVATSPGADTLIREGYNEEVISVGFWPGNRTLRESGMVRDAAFYAYVSPEPPGFSAERVRPAEAFYDGTLKDFALRYDDVRRSARPEAAILEFAQTTYEAAARLANWDRRALERVTTHGVEED
jgi:hypothetical protein